MPFNRRPKRYLAKIIEMINKNVKKTYESQQVKKVKAVKKRAFYNCLKGFELNASQSETKKMFQMDASQR